MAMSGEIDEVNVYGDFRFIEDRSWCYHAISNALELHEYGFEDEYVKCVS